MSSHLELQRALGAYVVGALDPAERAQVDAHLLTCAACREELASYAALPALMSRVSVQEVTSGAPVPPPTLLPRVLSAVAQERERGTRRLRRWQVAAAALAAAATVTALLVLAPSLTGSGSATRPLVAAAGVSASGAVTLESRPWGTAVRLRVDDLPPAPSYTAWVVDGAGKRLAVATWGPTPDGTAEVTGATALTPEAVRSLTVSTSDGRSLLTAG